MKFNALSNNASMTENNTPQKVVFVLPSLAAGGAERVLITLMNHLDRTRFAPELIVVRDHGSLRNLIPSDIPVHALGKRKVLFSLPALIFALRKTRPDVIISTMAHMNFAVMLTKPFLPKQTRVIIREAITPSFIIDGMKKGLLAKTAYRWLYPKADLVISPAQAIIDEFQSIVGLKAKNHTLLYNAVDIEHIRSVPQILQNITEERERTVHFICTGRLHRQKGFDRLIAALPWLSHDLDWTLTILGGGDERGALEKQIHDLGLENRVHLPGFSEKPWPQVGAADCFLLPSRSEGLPNVVLEALSVGTPVIATRESGGIEEIAKLSAPGSVTIADDMPAFIEAMRFVTPNPTRLFRPSILPPTFRLESVMKRFTDMVEGNGDFSSFATTHHQKHKKRKAA